MRVNRSVAMPGKVLAAAENSRLGISAHGLAGKCGDTCGVITVAAHPDNRVAAVAVDVQHRRKVEVHAHAAQLTRSYRGGGVCVLNAPCRGDGHVARYIHSIGRKACDHSALLIDRDKSRMPGLSDDERLNISAQLTQL